MYSCFCALTLGDREAVMPIPEMTEFGLLPAGVHDCTSAEAEEIFCHNDCRREIWEGFSRFLARLEELPQPSEILLDGSFVTDKVSPRDVDVVVDITNCNDNERSAWFEAFRISHQEIHEDDHVDFYPVVVGEGNDFSAFFQYVRARDALDRGCDPSVRKGILRIAV